MGNVKIRCRLEKIDKTGNYTQLKKAFFHWSMGRHINDTKTFNEIGDNLGKKGIINNYNRGICLPDSI